MNILQERYTRVHLPALHTLPADDWREPFLRDLREQEKRQTNSHLVFCAKMLAWALFAYGGTFALVEALR